MNKPYLRLASFALNIKKELLIKILLQLIIVLSYVIQGFMLSYGTAAVFAGNSIQVILIYYIFAALCITFRGILVRITEGYTKKVAGKIKAILRNQIVNKLISLGPKHHATKRSGKLQSLVTDGIEYVEPYLVNYIPQIFVVIVSSLSLGGYILFLNLKAGIIAIAAMLVSVFMPHIMMPFIKHSAMGYWKGYATLNAQYVDAMQGMNTLKALGSAERKGEELYHSAESFRIRQINWTVFSLISSATIALMMAIGKSFTVGVAALDMAKGLLTQPQLLIILFLIIECIRPISELQHGMQVILDFPWHMNYLRL